LRIFAKKCEQFSTILLNIGYIDYALIIGGGPCFLVLDLGMAIGLRPYGYPQKIPTMGRVKSRFCGFGHGSG